MQGRQSQHEEKKTWHSLFRFFVIPAARFDASRPQTLPLPACFSQKASANLVWSHPGNLPGAGQTDAKFDPVFAERIGVSGEIRRPNLQKCGKYGHYPIMLKCTERIIPNVKQEKNLFANDFAEPYYQAVAC